MKLLITMLCALLPVCAAAQPAPGLEFFPHDTPFRGPMADPAEPRMYLGRLHLERAGGGFGAAVAGLGYDFGLLRRHGGNPKRGWQLSLFGSAVVTLLYEVYEGFAPFGQFFVEDFQYRGVTLQFDF